jgi:putative hemolysin
MLMVRPMRLIAFVLSPIVVGLSALTELVLWPFGLHRAPKEAPVTEEEVNTLVEEGMKGGVFNESERDMVAGVLELDEMPVTYLTTPRPKLVFLDLADPDETNWRKVVASGHSHFPVVHGNKEQVIGMVSVKAMWANQAFGVPTSLRHLLTSPLIVPENMAASVVLEQFKRSGQHIALVNDEFGALAGVVTLYDVLEAIVGDIPESGRQTAPEVTTRPDGSLLMDATFEIDEFKELTKFDHLPHEEETEFQTVGGFVLTHFGRIPRAGDSFQFEGWQFEVMDMDRQRIDKILVSPPPKDTTKEPSEDTAGGI